jgi:hypothetical protein
MKMTVKILTLRTEAEAILLSGLLDQANIQHMLKSFHDSAYDGMWQTQTSWGTLYAYEEDRQPILDIYNNMSTPETQYDET